MMNLLPAASLTLLATLEKMSLTRYLIAMGLATVVSTVSWILVVAFLEPQSGFVGLILFFVSFFLAVFGAASIVGYLVRRIFQRHIADFKIVAVSFRQATLFAMLLSVSLFLQSQRLFTWWTAALLLVFLSLIEAFFIAQSESRQSKLGGSHGT